MTCPNLPASLPKAVPSLPPLSLYPFPPSTSAASSISPNTGWVANLFPPHWDVQLQSFWLQKRRRRRRRRRAVPSDKENTAVLCVLWKRPGPIWEPLKGGGGLTRFGVLLRSLLPGGEFLHGPRHQMEALLAL